MKLLTDCRRWLCKYPHLNWSDYQDTMCGIIEERAACGPSRESFDTKRRFKCIKAITTGQDCSATDPDQVSEVDRPTSIDCCKLECCLQEQARVLEECERLDHRISVMRRPVVYENPEQQVEHARILGQVTSLRDRLSQYEIPKMIIRNKACCCYRNEKPSTLEKLQDWLVTRADDLDGPKVRDIFTGLKPMKTKHR